MGRTRTMLAVQPGGKLTSWAAVPAGLLDGRYQLLDVLGRGGMGVVHRARDERLEREVAVKTIARLGGGAGERLRMRFHREARAAARLRHPNVVTVFDFGTDAAQDVDYIVLELLEGEDLAALIERRQRVPVAEALPILIGAARGIGAGHRAGLIHRDVKPGNLFLERDRSGQPLRVRVLDFGIAQIVDPEVTATALTAFGHVPYTPAFASPEQRDGRRELGFSSDVYSFSATAYRLLTGCALPGATERAPRTTMRSQLRKAGVPDPVTRVVMKALLVDPAKRYPDGDALADALEEVQRAMELTALRREWGLISPPPPQRTPPVRKDLMPVDTFQRSRTGFASVGLWAVVLLTLFVLGWCSAAG